MKPNSPEWLEALDLAARAAQADIARAVAAGFVPPPPGPTGGSATLASLVKMAALDREYAWFSAHLHARIDPHNNADMPARLSAAMKQLQASVEST